MVCPACSAPQDEGLLDANCALKLEQTLRSIPALVRELDVTLSRQARIGTPGKSAKGTEREKSVLHFGALDTHTNLRNTIVAWARAFEPTPNLTAHAAAVLLSNLKHIRRHAEVATLIDEITNAVHQARRTIDRPAERQYLGHCYAEIPATYVGNPGPDYCTTELYAKTDATTVTCKSCNTDHDVSDRRRWLMDQAADRLVTVREAATMIGHIGNTPITQAAIRGYLHRNTNPLEYRPGTKLIRLGDLLNIVMPKATA
jgi:hypothetical protein